VKALVLAVTAALIAVVTLGCESPPPAGVAPPSSSARAPSTSATTATSTSARETSASASALVPIPRPPEPELARILRKGDPRWTAWLDRAEELRLQILVRVIEPPSAHDKPPGDESTLRYRVDAEYVYPASAIKPFLAVAALRVLNAEADGEIPWNTRFMRCRDDKGGCEPPRPDVDQSVPPTDDGKHKHQKLRVGMEIHKLLSWSDNDAYNRLWDIVGHAEANEQMKTLGFSSVRLHHKMNAPAERSGKTLRVTLLPPGKRGIVEKRRVSELELSPTPAKKLRIGDAYNDEGKLVEEPLDFSDKNYASLEDLQRMMISLARPDLPRAVGLGITDDQRDRLLKAMARDPDHPASADHAPLLPGVLEALPKERLRYISKSGRAYGFHLENAYVENTETHRALFVAAVVYANPNRVLNDDDYAYDETSRPLLASLGEELTRRFLASEGTD
jgi:hypothetical protein